MVSKTAGSTRKRAVKPGEDAEASLPEEPTREDIYAAALWVAQYTNRVPCYFGPTASGKTYGAAKLAEENGAELITVLLSQHTPDEISGYQLALGTYDKAGNRIGERLEHQLPHWFRQAQDVLDRGKNVHILFDELGLSREEVRGAIYTFLRDRHLHGSFLKPKAGREVLLFAATNPGVFAPPMRSRVLFIPVPADKDYLKEIAKGSSFARRFVELAPIESASDQAYSNTPPPPAEVAEASAVAAVRIAAESPQFWNLTEPARYLVLSGLVPAQALSVLLKDNGLDASALARKWEELARALRALPRDKKHSMTNNVLETLPAVEKDPRADALLSILDVMYDDLMADDLQTYFSTPRSDEVVKSVADMDPEYLEKRLKERGLLMVETNSKGENKIAGSLAVRIQQMVKNTKGESS